MSSTLTEDPWAELSFDNGLDDLLGASGHRLSGPGAAFVHAGQQGDDAGGGGRSNGGGGGASGGSFLPPPPDAWAALMMQDGWPTVRDGGVWRTARR